MDYEERERVAGMGAIDMKSMARWVKRWRVVAQECLGFFIGKVEVRGWEDWIND